MTESSERADSGVAGLKVKLVMGSDIRRLKDWPDTLDELSQVAKRIHGARLVDGEQKFYYYDSDEDRINVSDDEDLDLALKHCKSSTMKLYVENYNVNEDSFFRCSSLPSKDEKDTVPSSNSGKKAGKDVLELMKSTNSHDDSFESEGDEFENSIFKEEPVASSPKAGQFDDEYNISFLNFADPGKNEEDPKELKPTLKDRKMTEQYENGFDLLDEKDCKVSSQSIPRGYSMSGNSSDGRFENTWAGCLSKEVQKQLNSEEFEELKKEWGFQVKAEKCFDLEYNRRRYSGLDKVYWKLRVATGNKEERDKLAMVEINEPQMGNDDIILWKQGSLISKSWIVKNVGCTKWPKNPRLVWDSKLPGLKLPKISEKLKPGEKMLITINLFIPENEKLETDAYQVALNLNSKKFGNFGEDLILSYHVDDELYDIKANISGEHGLKKRVKIL